MSPQKRLQASGVLPSDSSLKNIYINFDVDRFAPIEYTCSCGFENPIQVFSPDLLSQIRYLDLKIDVSGDDPSCTAHCFWTWMSLFPNLTELGQVQIYFKGWANSYDKEFADFFLKRAERGLDFYSEESRKIFERYLKNVSLRN
jgi:hypothetical protein